MENEEPDVVTELTVDLSKQTLKRIERANNEQKEAVILIANDNEIPKLDNLDSYANLKKLSLVNNHLVRMYGVSQLIHLEVLDLSNNALVTIEGLKDLKNLKELRLAKNKIKAIEHINSNLELQKMDLSDNSITHISDISHLKNLREFYLHGNKLTHLKQCEKNFPENIQILTLHKNLISDLNEVSHLAQFSFLKELSFHDNPCVSFVDDQIAFNYRPFIKNWCSSLIILDNHPLDDIECLKAEWLYSQGRGRSFKSGEQAALVEYLSNVCPMKEPDDDTEDVKKLKLILSKAQQHQKQLREQLSTGNLPFQDSYKIPRKKKLTGLSERMVTSCRDSPSRDHRHSSDLMSRSLDSSVIRNSPTSKSNKGDGRQTLLQTSTTFIPIPDTLISPDVCHTTASFLASQQRTSVSNRNSRSSSRNSPHSTPESKRKSSTTLIRKQNENSSPLVQKKERRLSNSRSGTPHDGKLTASLSPFLSGRADNAKESERNDKGTSEEEDSEILSKKSLTTQQRLTQKRMNKKRLEMRKDQPQAKEHFQEKGHECGTKEMEVENLVDSRTWKAAICIQRRWRGYRTRNLNDEVLAACKDIQLSRMQEYITKVINEMEAARIALEGNRKLQLLQMQAINALWKKMTSLQPNETEENSNESKLTIQELIATCSNLNKQVEGLQAMMKTMQNVAIPCQTTPVATQTEIVAVHTPQGDCKEVFPYIPSVKITIPAFEDSSLLAEKANCSNISSDEINRYFSPSKELAVSEIYANKNLEDKFSDQELYSGPKFQDDKEIQYLNVTLSKPLAKLNETSPNFTKKATMEKDLTREQLTENSDVQNGCHS